jgi:hypothetical protein
MQDRELFIDKYYQSDGRINFDSPVCSSSEVQNPISSRRVESDQISCVAIPFQFHSDSSPSTVLPICFSNDMFSDSQMNNNSNETRCVQVISQPLTSINTQFDGNNFQEKINLIEKRFNDITSSKVLVENVREINDILNEPRMTVKAILTDFVVEDITLLDSSPILVYLLNKLFRGLFDEYKIRKEEDYRLIYKGGNVIKLYFDDFVDNFFDPSLKPEIYTKYGSNFKVSDLDFGVDNFNLNTSKSRSQQSKDVIPLIWYVLQIARIVILCNMCEIFEFCRLDHDDLKYQIEPIMKKTQATLDTLIKELTDQLNGLMREFNPNDSLQEYSREKLTTLIEQLKDDRYIGICFNNFVYISPSDLQRIFEVNNNQFKFIDTFSEYEQNLINKGAIPQFFIDGTSDRRDGFNDTEYFPERKTKITRSYFTKHFNTNLYNDNFFNEDFQSIVNRVLPTDRSEIYITVSTDIITPRAEFSLVRLMMNFLLIYTKDNKLGVVKAPSELYDVTYSVSRTDMIQVKKSDKYNKYNYSFRNGKNELIHDSIVIWSPLELINDLLGILFQQVDFPWDDTKYQKRLIRLIFISRYIQAMYERGMITDVDITPYTMKNIESKYIDPLDIKIRSLTDQRLKKLYTIEMQNLRETVNMVQTDINNYFSRSITRRNYSSGISPLY